MNTKFFAFCVLERIGKDLKIREAIEEKVMLPSGGQGSLAIQIRKTDKKIFDLLQKINHPETQIEAECERAFLQQLGASCATPVAVRAISDAGKLTLKTIILDYDGSQVFETNSKSESDLEEAIKLGTEAAKKTKMEAGKLLAKICK